MSVVGATCAVVIFVGLAACGVAMLLDAWRRFHERRDELVAAERSRKIALWMRDASHWFGTGDGSASLVLREIANALDDGGLFRVDQVRERCRAAVKAAAPKGDPK